MINALHSSVCFIEDSHCINVQNIFVMATVSCIFKGVHIFVMATVSYFLKAVNIFDGHHFTEYSTEYNIHCVRLSQTNCSEVNLPLQVWTIKGISSKFESNFKTGKQL